ncbi:MAG: hypothetical protein K2Y21_08570 [Phycisphaerales bacterium]|nr:hypothetical protein [Phycisphaerales bacterium]
MLGIVSCVLGWIAMVVVVMMWGKLMPSAAIVATALSFGPLVAASVAAIVTGRSARTRDDPRWIEYAFVDALLVGLVAFALNVLLCLAAVAMLVARMQV